jgi:hypothetical protein
VAHVFADFSSKNVFFTEGGIFAAKTVKEPFFMDRIKID